MFKKILFQLHWLLGISAGLVLVVVGMTGGMLSFEREILLMLNPHIMRVPASAQTQVNLSALLDQVTLAKPDKRLASLTTYTDPELAWRVGFAHAGNKNKKGLDWFYINPYSGGLLGKARGEAFFVFVMKLHRWLVLDAVGKQIVGASTCALIFLCISGLYLRWPRNLTNWRTWLCFSFKRNGRSFLWDMHSVIGTWCLVFYLLAASTGLYWSYDWYRNLLSNLAGVSKPVSHSVKKSPAAHPLNRDAVWIRFLNAATPYQSATLRFPENRSAPVEIAYLPENAHHPRATNKLTLDAQTGALLKEDNFQNRSAGEQFINSIYALHTGSYFGLTGMILMMLASLMMPLFAITGWLLYLDRRAKKRALARIKKSHPTSVINRIPDLLIGFASQTGLAERLAWHTANTLKAAGMAVTVQPLSTITVAQLGNVQRALFVVSTFGEGGPPDSARSFSKLLNNVNSHVSAQTLHHLRFGLLALGDKQYQTFCQFGRQVEHWLQAHGATSLFNRIEVHQQDPHALELWRQQLTQLAPVADASPFVSAVFSDWTLQSRRCLNEGSQGLPTYHLEFQAEQKMHWQPGDLFEILLPDNQTVRSYSIASHVGDNALFLLVRQVNHQGQRGIGSNHLTHALLPGELIRARIKPNPAFHLMPNPAGLILIGNGTGLAGLRSHLKARIEQGCQRNWLIFGERNRAHDNYYGDELSRWQKQGWISQLDLVFSRDLVNSQTTSQTSPHQYVQHHTLACASQIRSWIADGASILVCGSLVGMGSELDNTLREILGSACVDQLIEQRRYLRDVY